MVVGSKIPGSTATIVTTNQDVDYPHIVQIDVVKKRITNEKQPKWAQYVLGNYKIAAPIKQMRVIPIALYSLQELLLIILVVLLPSML